MSPIRYTVFFAFFAVTPALAVDLSSRVAEVVVYPDGALITRQATLDLAAGEHDVTLVQLPPGLDAAELQIAVTDSSVQIGQVRVEREATTDAYDAEFRAAETAVQEQRLVIQAIDDASAAARLQLKFLSSFAEGQAKDAFVDGTRGTANVAVWREALDLLSEGSADANRILRENIVRRLEAERELTRREQELRALAGGNRRRSSATISVASRGPISATLALSYFDDNAGWQPVYEARLDSQTGELALAQIAEVEQATDEDWRSVKMTLSTGQPTGELEPPPLPSELLRLVDPRKKRSSGGSDGEIVVTGARIGSVADSSALEEIIVKAAPAVSINISDFAVDYAIPGLVDIANDADDAQTFELAAYRFDTELLTTVVPVESTEAFLQARFTYTEALPLFASNMRIYVDGTFAGESTMPSALPGNELTLPMGQDRRIEVRVRPQADNNDRRGVINRRRFATTHSLYEITNRRSTATLVEVVDRYPVAEDRDIKVEIARTATPPTETEIDDQPGIVKFVRRLEGGESWTIRQQYTVSYPANRTLSSR
ncbi:MAG: mucoidy inhibitor MuiA family protein [Pseudomonadota bacterium]